MGLALQADILSRGEVGIEEGLVAGGRLVEVRPAIVTISWKRFFFNRWEGIP